MIGAGPPCQGVCGLNASRRGALRDERSSLFVRVQRAKHHFKRAQARLLMESVASMDQVDREIMSASVGIDPVLVDASGITLCRRTSLVLVRLD